MIITIANQKGGVGKTTTAFYLAQAAIKQGWTTSVLLDADPQASAALWWQDVKDAAGFLVAATPSVYLLSNYLEAATPDEMIIIDTPPADTPPGIIKTAAGASDFVVIPTKAGSLEPERVMATLELIKGSPAGILVTDAKLGTNNLKDTVDGWTESGYQPLGVITSRVAIAADRGNKTINSEAVAQHVAILNKITERILV